MVDAQRHSYVEELVSHTHANVSRQIHSCPWRADASYIRHSPVGLDQM